jgi:hypothetical protein
MDNKKMPMRIFCSKQSGKMYASSDNDEINLHETIEEVPANAYKLESENNSFYVYRLTSKYLKKQSR